MTSHMARKRQPKIEEACPKALDMLGEVQQIVALIHKGLETPHGNRKLHDDLALGILLCAFFEPRARSLRTLDQLSAVPGVKELLGADRLAKSTLSDALARFNTDPLPGILRMILKRLPQLKQADPVLASLSQNIIAGDGSWLPMAGEVAWALQHHNAKPAKINSHAKLHLQMDVRRCTPRRLQITGKDDSNEQTVLGQNLESGVIYLLDRGYCGFDLLNRMLALKSRFVIRIKKDWVFRVQRENPLSEEEKTLEIRSDELGRVGKAKEDLSKTKTRESEPPEGLLRRVTIWDAKNNKTVILLTDLLEVEAKIIGYLYRCRWLIELFFRWLKVTAGFAHLVSQSPSGVTAQMYVAMIGTLLIHLHTGMPPSKYSLYAMEVVMSGRASYADMLPGVLRLERERKLEKERLARKRAEKMKV
jgi:putative transposase